jgi:hypothetical protein
MLARHLLLGKEYCTLTLYKGVPMWYGVAQSGPATTGVNFSDSLSLLIVGLVSLVWLSAGLIAVLALQHHWSQPRMRSLEVAVPDASEHREAA